jgi:hypothetical protein
MMNDEQPTYVGLLFLRNPCLVCCHCHGTLPSCIMPEYDAVCWCFTCCLLLYTVYHTLSNADIHVDVVVKSSKSSGYIDVQRCLKYL